MPTQGKAQLEDQLDAVEDVVEDMFPALVGTVVVSVVILVFVFLRVFIRWSVRCISENRIDGKTVLITGGNSGIGKAAAIALAKRGARVIITSRNEQKGDAIARSIRQKTGNQLVFAVKLDLSSLHSIYEFAEEFNAKEASLHILINNAAYLGPKATTEDNIERNFGVNYLGHFYLTYLLADKLRKHAPSRIINVVSDCYINGKLDFEDIAMTKGYESMTAYGRSKLAMLIWTVELHRRCFSDVVLTFAVNPGTVATDLYRSMTGLKGKFYNLAQRFMFKSPDEGCQTIVYCAVADGIRECSGRMFVNCNRQHCKDYIRDRDVGQKLWELSMNMCGLDRVSRLNQRKDSLLVI